MVQKLAHITGLCFDFDGVFYRISHVPNIHEESDIIMAHSAVEILGDKIDFQQAKQLSHQSYKEYGDCLSSLMIWVNEKGIDEPDLRNKLFESYHQKFYDKLLHLAPEIFVPETEIKTAFEKCKGHVANGIATHGCVHNYALPILNQKELSGYFTDHALFGLNDAGYNRKNHNTHLIQKCFNALNTSMAEGGFVEDTVANLKVAKENHPELTTIYIHHGAPLPNQPTHVDYQFHNILELKNAIFTAKEERQIILL